MRLLRGLSAPLGVYGIEGHHDHKYRIAQAFEEGGATLLRDEFVKLSGNGTPVVIAGMSTHPTRPLVDIRGADKMQIVIQEILQDKIYLDSSGEVKSRGPSVADRRGGMDDSGD